MTDPTQDRPETADGFNPLRTWDQLVAELGDPTDSAPADPERALSAEPAAGADEAPMWGESSVPTEAP